MNGNNEDNKFFSNKYKYPSQTYSLNMQKQNGNCNSFEDENEQKSADKIRNYNESLFSFRYLNKIRNIDNYKKCNNKFFNTEYKHIIENIKDSQPDIYFKHKLDEIKTNIEGLKIKYKKSERMFKMESEKNILHKNKSDGISSFYFLTVLYILMSILFYFFYRLNPLQALLKILLSFTIQSYSSLFFLFAIACLIIILILTNNYSHSTNLRFKLIAEKCIRELEIILTNNEEGSIVEVEQFSRIYCRNNNIAKEDFEKSILWNIKEFINLDETNLCIVEINNNSYFKFKTSNKYWCSE